VSAYSLLLTALVALLAGLTVGKAWERYKLRDGRWIDRRRARESPHYILGLNFLVANQIDLAIEELSRAASLDADALEVHMILGNLYREKGQVGKAITQHQNLLQRPKLSKLEHAYVLLCLGLDYKRGGFVVHSIRYTGAKMLRNSHDIGMGAIGHNALAHLEVFHPHAYFSHYADIAISQWQRLCELGLNSFNRRHQPIALDFFQHHLHSLWLLACLLQQGRSAKTDEHAFGPRRN